MIEIKFVGRGGQGGKSAAAILAEAALESGSYIQSFPEYGAERQGAPVNAYTRIDDKPIRIHYGIKTPDIVVVLDPTLLTSLPVTEGMKDDGTLVVNTSMSPAEVRDLLNFRTGKVMTVDATKISLELFGRNIPNTPILGAMQKIPGLVSVDIMKARLEHKFLRKIGKDATLKNLDAVDRAFDEVNEG